MPKKVKEFLKRWIINTLGVLLATYLIEGIHFDKEDWLGFLLATLTLGILNAVLRPILVVLSLPLVLVSLGLFMVVINAFLLYLVAELFPSFHVDSFFPAALLGAIVIGIVSLFLNFLTGSGNTRIKIQRGRRGRRTRNSSRKMDDDSGGGPVIDV